MIAGRELTLVSAQAPIGFRATLSGISSGRKKVTKKKSKKKAVKKKVVKKKTTKKVAKKKGVFGRLVKKKELTLDKKYYKKKKR